MDNKNKYYKNQKYYENIKKILNICTILNCSIYTLMYYNQKKNIYSSQQKFCIIINFIINNLACYAISNSYPFFSNIIFNILSVYVNYYMYQNIKPFLKNIVCY